MLARVLCGGMVFKELLCSWCQPVCTFGFGLMVMKWRISNYLLWKIAVYFFLAFDLNLIRFLQNSHFHKMLSSVNDLA